MLPAYMPFTYLSESTARILTAIVGPVVVYQPSETHVPASLLDLAAQGQIEIRRPIATDDQRLAAALAEFTEWARMNPGRTTPGSGFFATRQVEIPFFDETTVNRIRSDIKHYHDPDPRPDRSDGGFSARLFLAVAQENDLATDRLDQDLDRFKALEKGFLESLKGADEADFNREAYGQTLWKEDPGARLTEQRIRAWATLAAADQRPPTLLVTTSSAVMGTISERYGPAIDLEKLIDVRLALPATSMPPVLGPALSDLIDRETLTADDLLTLADSADTSSGPFVSVSLFRAARQTPASVIGRLASMADANDVNTQPESVDHTLIILVKG